MESVQRAAISGPDPDMAATPAVAVAAVCSFPGDFSAPQSFTVDSGHPL